MVLKKNSFIKLVYILNNKLLLRPNLPQVALCNTFATYKKNMITLFSQSQTH